MQATLRFPGLQQVIRWSYTLSHGITPGVCTIDVAPQFGVPDEVGTLRLQFGPVRLQFPECVVDFAAVRRSSAGMVVGLTLLDRRWKWKLGAISGRYNLRTSDGSLDQETEKTPQQLATLLLQAMGESGFSVDELPNQARPEVDWVASNPAGELAALCDSLGCRVVLGIDNRVALRRIGQGGTLPLLDALRTQRIGIDPPARPDSLKLVAGPTRFQTKFRLEAVGEDHDGTIRPINDLSYKPAEGWGTEPYTHFSNVADADDRARARATVYRWYRIKCTAPDDAAGTFRISGQHGPVTSLWQFLPLENGLIDVESGNDKIKRPRPPLIDGTFWAESPDGENLGTVRRYEGRFTLDTARGIVRFAQPVLKRNTSDDTYIPAELNLTVAHPLRESATREEVRFSLERRLPGSPLGTGPQIVRRDELAETIIHRGTNEDQTNHEELNREANAALDAAQAEFQTLQTSDAEYAGLIPISPDGAIRQIAWSGGPNGAVTRASRNQEFSTLVPAWKERRAIEANRLHAETSRRLLRAQWRLMRGDR